MNPLSKQPVILLIVPVYNEKATIRSVISELMASSYNHIIVVDDGSDEDIVAEISDLPVVYLRHRINMGQGAALQTGFYLAKQMQLQADVIVTFDADAQHDCRDIVSLVEPVVCGEADIVFGSRFLSASIKDVPAIRKYVLQCGRFVNYLFTGILLTDAHNGLRAFNTGTLKLLQLTENGMAHATEILYLVKKYGLRYKEVGVNVRYTSYSKAKGQRHWNSIRIFSDLVLHKLFRSSSK
jgi:polyprenyl-phospho-N-acetylgalactosaminyl synthase